MCYKPSFLICANKDYLRSIFFILLSLFWICISTPVTGIQVQNIGCGRWIVANNGERYLPGWEIAYMDCHSGRAELFDGNHIKVFNHFHNDSISYGNLYVTQMVEDGQGSLFPVDLYRTFPVRPWNRKILYSSGDFSLHSCQRKDGSVDCRRRETVLIR